MKLNSLELKLSHKRLSGPWQRHRPYRTLANLLLTGSGIVDRRIFQGRLEWIIRQLGHGLPISSALHSTLNRIPCTKKLNLRALGFFVLLASNFSLWHFGSPPVAAHQQEDYFKLKTLGIHQILNIINSHMLWRLLDAWHVSPSWDRFLLLSSANWASAASADKMLCGFGVLLVFNDI